MLVATPHILFHLRHKSNYQLAYCRKTDHIRTVDSSIAPAYIVIEGPIGVGKTSLCRRLAKQLGSEVLLEQPEDNPFLERFYQSPRQFALPTQLFFLFQRARQLSVLKQQDMFVSALASDFMLDKDMLFAKINLDDDEFRLYQQVYEQLSLEVPLPDLVIYLQAPVEVLVDRINRRGIDYERSINTKYLEKLANAYTEYFYKYNSSPLLTVNATHINLVDNDHDFGDLMGHIRSIKTGRHFFNPLAEQA